MRHKSVIHKRSGVYALHCPETKKVRYVGRSVNISSRFNGHMSSRANYPVNCWIRSLKERGLRPEITVLEYHDKPEEVEAKWISQYKSAGQADLNLHDGGKGCAMSGAGRCRESWSVEGMPSPFNLAIRAVFRFRNNSSGKIMGDMCKESWNSCKTEFDRINASLQCYELIRRIGSQKIQIQSEKWAMAAASQINAKFPGYVTLVYNDGVEETP